MSRNVYDILARNPEEKGECERSRCRWEENIKLILKNGV
jgi:hypothetical protein